MRTVIATLLAEGHSPCFQVLILSASSSLPICSGLFSGAFCKQIPISQAHSLTNLSENSIRSAYDLFRSQILEKFKILKRKVQLDQTFFFGSKGKALMLGKQIGTKDLAYAIYNTVHLNRNHAAEFLFQSVEPRTRLQTDGGGIYKGIAGWWPVEHKVDIHRKFEFGLTSEIEGMFGVFRTFIRRMYHHITPQHFADYVREFVARFSSPEMFSSPNDYLAKTLIFAPID